MEKKDKKVIFRVSVSETTKEQFEEVCAMAGLHKSDVVETLLKWFMNPKETI